MGLLLNEFRVSVIMLMGGQSADDLLERHRVRMMAVLPVGTTYLGCERLNRDLQVVYSLAFDHPMFEDGTTVEEDYVCHAYFDPNKPERSVVEQCHVLLGVRYYRPDGRLFWDRGGRP